MLYLNDYIYRKISKYFHMTPVLLRLGAWVSSILVPVGSDRGTFKNPDMEMHVNYYATGNNSCIGPFSHF